MPVGNPSVHGPLIARYRPLMEPYVSHAPVRDGLDQITPAVNHCHEPPAIGPTALVGKPRVNGPLMAR